MPSSDLTKCASPCALKGLCWRFLAPDTPGQSYALLKPEESGDCAHYWPIHEERE
jgi:hypothetical protein